jgi:hypothetical protein
MKEIPIAARSVERLRPVSPREDGARARLVVDARSGDAACGREADVSDALFA